MAAVSASDPTKVSQFIQENPEFKDQSAKLSWKGFINLVAGHREGPKDKEIVAFLLSGGALPEKETLIFNFLKEASRLNKSLVNPNFEKLNRLLELLQDENLPVLKEALFRFKKNRALVEFLQNKCGEMNQESGVLGRSPLATREVSNRKKIWVFVLALAVASLAVGVFFALRTLPETQSSYFSFSDLTPFPDFRAFSNTLHTPQAPPLVQIPSPLNAQVAEMPDFFCDLQNNECWRG